MGKSDIYESVDLDKRQGKILITKQKTFDVGDLKSVKQAKKILRDERSQIIRQVKALKSRAEEINIILQKLEGVG